MNTCCVVSRQEMPDWYVLEKGTAKAIKMLTDIKDLSFYLSNPDEYIRRLAIIRLGELNQRNSINSLMDVLDAPFETSQNKELAAWAIKVAGTKWNIDLYINNKILNKYSGNEKPDELFKVSILDSIQPVKFKFPSGLISSQLQIGGSGVSQGEDLIFEANFSTKDWINSFTQKSISTLKNFLKNIPIGFLKIFNILKKVSLSILKSIFIKLPVNLLNLIKKLKINRKQVPKHRKEKSTISNKYYLISPSRDINIFPLVKVFFINLLYIIFFPIRFIRKHKGFAFLIVTGAYLFLCFTTPGKNFFYNYTGMYLKDIQDNAINSTKSIVSYTVKEIKDFAGINDTIEKSTDNLTAINNPVNLYKYYRVTAKSGLNIRKEPRGSAIKVSSRMLAYNSTVKYLDQSKKDSSGQSWLFVETPDNIKGWVSSRWLEETTGGEENAG